MYDVIIAGAGPAGCAAAKILADKGFKVLIAERAKLPRYKSCSGQLIRKSVELIRSYFGESVPEAVMCRPFYVKGMVFTDDGGREYRFEQNGINCRRSSFDDFLVRKAVCAGAELRDDTSVIRTEEEANCVKAVFSSSGNEYSEKAVYLIACDGAAGSVSRRISGYPQSYVYTYQKYIKGNADLDKHYFYAYLQPQLSQYDAWLNFKDDHILLGTAVTDVSRTEHYFETFTEYMKKRHSLEIYATVREDKWIMPQVTAGCPVNCGAGRILLSGEAAGFLNPMGEGISSALESGHLAGSAVTEYFTDSKKVLSEYKKSLEPLHSYMKSQWRFTARLSLKFGFMK